MLDFTTLTGARAAFKQLYNQVQTFLQWDAKGNQVHNVGDPQTSSDAANLKSVTDAIGALQTALTKAQGSPELKTIIANLVISTSFQPLTDNSVDIGTTALAFKHGYLYALRVKGLTASLPLKLDSNKDLLSEKIKLANASGEVQGILDETNGGTGTSTAGINGAITLGTTPGAQSVTTGAQSSATGSQSLTTTTLQYKDWAGSNQSLTVVTGVTLQTTVVTSVSLQGTVVTAASVQNPALIAASLTTNNFTNGKRTT
jgi:hypothetical protein